METKALPRTAPNPHPRKGDPKVVPYEYAVTLACGKIKSPDQNVDCGGYSSTACVGVDDATGPLSFIWRRVKPRNGEPSGWSNIAMTCWPELVPGAKPKPRITVAMLRSAFVKTPFAKPTVGMEPVGNRTLVNLPSYFSAGFAGAGYGPGEVRTFTLLGHKVRIKPVLKSNTFHFGDGTSLGPTESSGGGYPDGDVKHTYTERGTMSTSITTVYAGQVAIDNGKFVDLPGSTTVTGPAQPIEVLEATGRLVR